MSRPSRSAVLTMLALLVSALGLLARPAIASHTPDPASVTIAGSLDSEIGCSGDWQPDCAAAHIAYDSTDTVWEGVFAVPAGSYEYKAALNDSWTENYGAPGGGNVQFTVATDRPVKFYYDHRTHWMADSAGSVIAIAPGSFQSELGCPGDWQPDCLRSWLEDPDGDGTYEFSTAVLPAGFYETKVAINESWSENYGAGGTPNGANIPFTVPQDNTPVTFSYEGSTHVLAITVRNSDGEPDCDNAYTSGDDVIVGTPGDDVLCGGDGADEIVGRGGDDIIYGDAGNDVLSGKKGSDTIHGGAGDDSLTGGYGPDVLDAVDGVQGNDSVSGGRGADTCTADQGDAVAGC